MERATYGSSLLASDPGHSMADATRFEGLMPSPRKPLGPEK
jgi:hypothetical protein